MKVGVVVDNEYRHDVRVKREVQLLKKFGFQISILCLKFNRSVEYNEEGVSVNWLFIPKKVKDILYFTMNILPIYEWWWRRKVTQFIKENDVDVIHTHDLYMAKSARKGIDFSGRMIPLILDLHENYPYAIKEYSWANGLFRSLIAQPGKWLRKEAKYLGYADKVIVLSEHFKNDLLMKYPFLTKDQIIAFPNVVDIAQFDQFEIDKTIQKRLPSNIKLLYFGAVAERRGIFQTLAVVRKLVKEELSFNLVIIGPIDKSDRVRFSKEIEDEIIRNYITYIPWIDLSELPSYLQFCDIALAPFKVNQQHESGIANKIFQYMYGGLPIVASNCKPQRDLIEKFKLGMVYVNEQDFKEKLQWLIENETEREAMGERSKSVLRKEFDQDTYATKFFSLYDEIESS